jgi:hypothetical protein
MRPGSSIHPQVKGKNMKKPVKLNIKSAGGCNKSACRTRIVVVPGSARPEQGQVMRKPCGHAVTEKNCCRSHMVVLPGYGQQQFPFPTADQVVKAAVRRLSDLARKARALSQADKDAAAVEIVARKRMIPGVTGATTPRKGLVSQLPGAPAPGGSIDPTLFAVAEGLRVIFHRGRFEAIIAEKFDQHTGAVNWARNHMPPKYQPAIESLREHLTKLQDLYRQTLPRVMDFLAAQHPEAPKEALQQAAIAVIDEQLAEILFVLGIWTQAFGQLRDGQYKQLEAVVYTVEQAYHLFRTGDISGACDEDCQKRIKSRVFGIEDVFVARFSGFGPATIPGTRGPVGAHAIEVPHDERDIITLMLVLYLHEFRHDVFHDVEGLAEEMTRTVIEAIQSAHKQNPFKFTTDQVQLGRGKVAMVDLITKVFADTIGEVDADIAGGVLLSGPAFLYNMLATFSAFNAKEEGVFGTPRLLRSGSVYEVDENGGIHFAVHLPDYIRAYVVAAGLEALGFKDEADDCRARADQAAGLPLPEDITWVDAEGKRKMVVKIPVADLKLVAPVVVDAIMNTKLKSLGGVSMRQIINWTPRRQDKVNILVQNLMDGRADVPTDKGDYFATYVAAAATLACWGLVRSRGMHPENAARQVEANALKMLDTVRARLEAKSQSAPAVVVTPGAGPTGDGKVAEPK